MNTPQTDEIIKYCECQFPATQGHIPLREMIEKIEIENILLKDEVKDLRERIEMDYWPLA